MSDLKIKRALIAVYDKTGIVEFARALVDEFGIEILSTGGTAKHLKDAGVPVTMVEQVTGFPEMLDGRVKTLHPKIHAGILADRDNPEHMRQLKEHGIEPIDMVVVNLYPFEKTVADPNCTFEQAIEMIDIGGPCMLRAAAKNHRHVVVVPDGWYETVLGEMRQSHTVGAVTRLQLAGQVFGLTNWYDMQVASYLQGMQQTSRPSSESMIEAFDPGYESGSLMLDWRLPLRYGENPHQAATAYLVTNQPRDPVSLFCLTDDSDPEHREPLSGGVLSFNNYVDGDSALSLVKDLSREPKRDLSAGGHANKEPRASARAVPVPGRTLVQELDPSLAPPRSSAVAQPRFHPPSYGAPAWFLTWTTYGQWLPGDERGFVSRDRTDAGQRTYRSLPGTEYSADEKDLEASARERMSGTPVTLTPEQARCVYEAIIDAAPRHGIELVALSVMANHVHLLCQTNESDGSRLMQLFKGNASSALGKRFELAEAPRWFTKSGSKRHAKKGDDFSALIAYIAEQKHPLCMGSFEGETFAAAAEGIAGEREVQPVRETARAEARGSLGATVASEMNAPGEMNVRGEGNVRSDRETARAETRGALNGAFAVAFIKHTNACGCAIGDDPIDTYRRAYLGDPIAAAGGVLCVNFPVTRAFADVVMNTFGTWGKAAGAAFFKLDVWIAPAFDEDALQLITTPTEKRKWGAQCRLLAVGDMSIPPDPNELDYKKISGGMLVQTRDLLGLNEDQWKVVSKRAPSERELADLRLAWLIAKHTKSNAISVVRDGMLLGSGAGQMSRVKSCDLAIQLARENGHSDQLAGAVAAGDAFFPVPDGPGKLIDAGITAIIHPGGSNRDAETIELADRHNVAMVITGTRHFKH